ncbi:MAG: hypothetical protein AB7T10_00180 [bacterium]
MVKRIFLFLLIISFFFIFSSREPNYDDIIYLNNGKHISENGVKSILERDWPFAGTTVKLTEGTHSIMPLLFYALLYKLGFSLFFMHLLIYVIYASMLFPLEALFSRLKAKHPLALSVLFLINPAVSLYANSFMSDIPAFSLLIFSLFFLVKNFEKKNLIYPALFIIFAVMSILFSYTSFFIFPLIFIAFEESRKKKNLVLTGISFTLVLSIIVIMNLLSLAPTLFRSISWFGSERLFNYHRTLEKVLSLFVWTGLFALSEVFKKHKNNFILSAALALLAAGVSFSPLLTFNSIISRILLFLLLFSGIFSTVRLFIEKQMLVKGALLLCLGLFSVLLFPMIIGRYILTFLFFFAFLIFRNESFKPLIFSIAFSASLSALLLTSDMLQSKSYRNLDFTGSDSGESISLAARRKYFIGEWGYRYQAEKMNAEPMDLNNLMLKEGDILFAPMLENMSDITSLSTHLKLLKTDSFFDFPLKTLSKESGSGYYTSMYGILPFSISKENSVKNYHYRYREIPNKHLIKYAERVTFWDGEAVIPSNLNDTLLFDMSEGDTLKVRFFPDARILKSDGITLTCTLLDSNINKRETSKMNFSPKENEIMVCGESGLYMITFSKNKNSSYDWFGITVTD